MSDIRETTVNLSGNRELQRRTAFFDVSLTLSVLTIAGALLSQRPEVLALGAPFIVAVVASLATWRPLRGRITVRTDMAHVIEGDVVQVLVDVASPDDLARVEVEIEVSDRLSIEGSTKALFAIDGGHERTIAFPALAAEWGLAEITKVRVRIVDRLGFFGGQVDYVTNLGVRIGLPEQRLRASLDADRFRRVVGSHLSGDRGQGLELADIRPFMPGDSLRDLNWRISNRRREPWVTLRHPDRSSTVVVVVDAHDGTDAAQQATQKRSVQAAMAMARGHLAQQDPVGLLVVGHSVRWLAPRLGRNQLVRIADELITISNAPDASLRLYRPPAVQHIPSEAIVVAVSPLRDPLMVALLAELRGRGNPVSVLVPQAESRGKRASWRTRMGDLSIDLASLEGDIGRQSLQRRGVVLVPWGNDEPITSVLHNLRRVRAQMRRAAMR